MLYAVCIVLLQLTGGCCEGKEILALTCPALMQSLYVKVNVTFQFEGLQGVSCQHVFHLWLPVTRAQVQSVGFTDVPCQYSGLIVCQIS